MSTVLDTITLTDGRQLEGIIDFVTSKQIYFFDFSGEIDEDFTIISILWKGNNPELRFSVYCAIYYPHIMLPRALIIPISTIESTSNRFKKTKRVKVRRSSIRLTEN